MVIRRFILDLQLDGSVKWAEVSECNIEANERAIQLRSRIEDIKDSETERLAKTYWEGYLDGINATMKLY